jgi:hypothetical protein
MSGHPCDAHVLSLRCTRDGCRTRATRIRLMLERMLRVCRSTPSPLEAPASRTSVEAQRVVDTMTPCATTVAVCSRASGVYGAR